MGRFMNKRELVLIVLLILVFDLNGFCDMITSHIPFKGNFSLFTYLLSIIFLLFDVYVFHYVVTHEPEHEVSYKVASYVETEKRSKAEEEIEKLMIENEGQFNLSEKVVVNFIAIAVIMMIVFSVYFSAKSKADNINSMPKVLLLIIPLLFVVSSLCAFANIYLNL